MRSFLLPNDLSSFIDELFYRVPTETKPPMGFSRVYDDDGIVIGSEIQMALAGFQEDDIDVKVDEDYIYLRGDNTKRDNVHTRFLCSFSHKIPYNKKLDVKNTKVSLENGILTLRFLFVKQEDKKLHLFGTQKKLE